MTQCGAGPYLEALEARRFLSDVPGLTPAQVRHAYGFDQLSFTQIATRRSQHGGGRHASAKTIPADGSGQTIAIVDAFHAPTIAADLKVFDTQFNLPDTDANGKFCLTVATPQGLPTVDSGWASEISLDVEWAHAIAPKAHILLVEARSDSTNDLIQAIDYARRQKGVVAISMSWGGDESPFDSEHNQILTTPKRHVGGSGLRGGVTFVTSGGDDGAFASWPASSPNAITVGGTSLSIDAAGNWLDEVGWEGSGIPLNLEYAASPDVAYNADPNVGFAVYDSTPDNGDVGWQVIGGTSAGAPQWAALVALADQGRAIVHKGSLDGPSQVKQAIYHIPAADFHDITIGANGFPAGPGYDLVSGRGSPKADKLVWDLISY
jgi:subtilase family serine protease